MPIQESPRLIKAQHARPRDAGEAFHIDDWQRQCDEYTARARQHAEELVNRAAAQADAIRRHAYAEGRAAGEQAALDAAQEQMASRVDTLVAGQTRARLETTLPALDRLIAALEEERERWLMEWETAAVRLSALMAGKLLRKELSSQPALVVDVVREALQLVAGNAPIELRLHPLDVEQLQEHGPEIIERLSHIGATALLPDESITRGGCFIATQQGTIDARIESQLARIVGELIEG